VEALVRACALFERGDREGRNGQRRAHPLAWDDDVRCALGVGPKARTEFAARGITAVGNLVWTIPAGWDDLRAPVSVAAAVERARGAEASGVPVPRQCVCGIVKAASVVFLRGRRGVRVIIADPGDPKSTINAWWFYAAHGILSIARAGAACLLVGRLRVREGTQASVAHPDLLRDEPEARRIRARYPALGVPPGAVRRAIGDALARLPTLHDPVPPPIVAREGMEPAEPLLRSMHGASAAVPPAEAALALADRLAWVEAFSRVWQRLSVDALYGEARAPRLIGGEGAVERLVASLGFALTRAQEHAIEAVRRDMAREVPMRRLLLGDVGTGKTAVALAAAALCVGAGHQCALLAPTSVLAEQYMDATAVLGRSIGARVVRFVGGMRAADRSGALEAVASGEAAMVVGTHALLGQDVSFARLGLVVVDEQQRLGVAQRLALVCKAAGGRRPHLLSLSATPIPRTMALALRGELATTVLDEKPPGRAPVATEVCPRSAYATAVLGAARAACARGERAFFVVPRVADDDEADESGVEAWAARLARDIAPVRVGTMHGAMPSPERTRAMRAFRHGDTQVLVATTVVEVGVDIPQATLMIVDEAERFGLSQLHQLRGRVGRGALPGRCLLLHGSPLTPAARQRLDALARTHDGGEIARIDLALRGAGELGGTRQSGLAVDFEWLDPLEPPGWIDRIEGDARALLAQDPTLSQPDHRPLALAMRRFATTMAVREDAG
jgi:ATP-dependent DNA helicase RecG